MSDSSSLAYWLNNLPVKPSGNNNQLELGGSSPLGVADWASDNTWKESPTHLNDSSAYLVTELNTVWGGFGSIQPSTQQPWPALQGSVDGLVVWSAPSQQWVIL